MGPMTENIKMMNSEFLTSTMIMLDTEEWLKFHILLLKLLLKRNQTTTVKNIKQSGMIQPDQWLIQDRYKMFFDPGIRFIDTVFEHGEERNLVLLCFSKFFKVFLYDNYPSYCY